MVYTRTILAIALLCCGRVALADDLASFACDKVGPGKCTFTVSGQHGIDGDEELTFWQSIQIFDNNCKEIGYKKDPKLYETTPFSVFSALRWTTDVTQLVPDSYAVSDRIKFKYGAYHSDDSYKCKQVGADTPSEAIMCKQVFDC